MGTFMADRSSPGMGQRYNREGLFQWYQRRFAGEGGLTEEDFRTQSRAKLQDQLLEISKKTFPQNDHFAIDEQLAHAYAGARVAEPADAQEICAWVKTNVGDQAPSHA